MKRELELELEIIEITPEISPEEEKEKFLIINSILQNWESFEGSKEKEPTIH